MALGYPSGTTGFLDGAPTVINAMIQTGMLVRELEEGLDSNLAYRRVCIMEEIPGRVGESIIRTRKGRKAPITLPVTGTANVGLDNGLAGGGLGTANNTFQTEQYSFTLNQYMDTMDLNLMQNEAGIADQFVANARNNAVQAAQSLERICRQRLFSAYLGGNTRCINVVSTSSTTPIGSIAFAGATYSINVLAPAGGNVAANSTTNVNVDDIRGFQTVLANGVLNSVSSTNPVNVVYTTAAGVSTANTVTAAAAYTYTLTLTAGTALTGQALAQATALAATLVTSTPDAIPGILTLGTALGGNAANLDLVTATSAPAILRPLGRASMQAIQGSDVLSLGICEDGVAYLRDNAVPPMPDGTYHVILDNTSMRQLFADQDFKVLFAGRSQSPEYREMDIVSMLGMTFVPTTEAYVQQQASFSATTPFLTPTGIKIRRPLIIGAEAIIQGNFEGMETFLNAIGVDNARASVAMVDGVVQIVRAPLDRAQQQISQTWFWVGDFAVPTDITATSSIIPTASNALYKRACVVEHAG